MKDKKDYTRAELKENLVIAQRQSLGLEKDNSNPKKLENLKEEIKIITDVLSK